MPNGVFECKWHYLDADGNAIMPAAKVVSIPYTTVANMVMWVRGGTAQGAEVDATFPGLVAAGTLIVVENETSQELNMAWGGNFFPHIPPGGVIIFAYPAAPAAGQITGLRFFTTQAQLADEKVVFTVLGS
jgi:hypothetical protein